MALLFLVLTSTLAMATTRVSLQSGSGTEAATVTNPLYVSTTGGSAAPADYSGDQLVKSGSGVIIDAAVYYKGVTVGDAMVLKDSLTATGTTIVTFYAPTANGFTPIITRGFAVDNGIYMDQTVSGGLMGLNITYQ